MASFSASMKGVRCATAFFITRADFYYLRQEHFSGAEQVADYASCLPSAALRSPATAGLNFTPRFFGIGFDVSVDAFHQRVRQGAPLQCRYAILRPSFRLQPRPSFF